MENLTVLANKYQSDKGTTHGAKHKYTYIYDMLFYPLRDKAINFLEMGLAIGGPEVEWGQIDRRVDSPSVLMWLDYFKKANVFGFDISDFSHMKLPRFDFTRGDSGSIIDLRRLAETAPCFDVIIDDASHASYHQQLALKVLYSRISYGGLYIIEDLQWQSPFFEESLPKVPTTTNFLRSLFENDEYIENELISSTEAEAIKADTISFSALGPVDEYHDTTKMIIMRRRDRHNF